MKFAKNLIEASKKYRLENLNSTDMKDATLQIEDWTKIKVTRGEIPPAKWGKLFFF